MRGEGCCRQHITAQHQQSLQGAEAHKKDFHSKASPHDENQFFRPFATVSKKYHFSGLLESVRLLAKRRLLSQLCSHAKCFDFGDGRKPTGCVQTWGSCNTSSRRRGHGLRRGADRRASHSHSLERTWLDTNCVVPQTDDLQVNVAAEPLSVCSHRSMCVAVRAMGKRTSCCHSDLIYTSVATDLKNKWDLQSKARARYR